MPVVKSKLKPKTKTSRTAGSLVAKGHASKATKTNKKKTSIPSVDSGYSLYSTDSEDPTVYANRGLDRCAALLANILESDDSERVGTKPQKCTKKGKVAAKPAVKATKKPQVITRQKSQPKPPQRALKVPTAEQDISDSFSHVNRSPNLSTRSRPMSPFKADQDMSAQVKSTPYNERLPSSTPINSPSKQTQVDHARPVSREKQHGFPVQYNKYPIHEPYHMSSGSAPPPHLLQQRPDFHMPFAGFPGLHTGYLRQHEGPVYSDRHLYSRTNAKFGYLDEDPTGYHSDPLAYSSNAHYSDAIQGLSNRNPSFDHVYYHSNPNYGVEIPERDTPQYYPVHSQMPNVLPPSHERLPVTETYGNYNSQPRPAAPDYSIHHTAMYPQQTDEPIDNPPANVDSSTEGIPRTPVTGYENFQHFADELRADLPLNSQGSITSVRINSSKEMDKSVTVVQDKDQSHRDAKLSEPEINASLDGTLNIEPEQESKPISPFKIQSNTSFEKSRSDSSKRGSFQEKENAKATNQNVDISKTPGKTPPGSQSRNTKSNQVHTLKYLLGELRAVTGMQGDIEISRLLDEIEYAANAIPHVRETINIETDIQLALQPLRSENSQLRRRLRIVNQQLKEREHSEKENKDGTMGFELLAAQTMNATIQKQMKDDKRHRDMLLTKIDELNKELNKYQDEKKKMMQILDEKDSNHLKSRQEWTGDLSKLRNNHEQVIAKLAATEITLEASVKENDILRLAMKQRDAEVTRMKVLNEDLQQSVSNLLLDLESHKPSERSNYWSVPQDSMQRLERLLRPNPPTRSRQSPQKKDFSPDYRATVRRQTTTDKKRTPPTLERTMFRSPTNNTALPSEEMKISPAQRSLNFGISPERSRLKETFQFVDPSTENGQSYDALAKTLTDSCDEECSSSNHGYHRVSPVKRNLGELTKENLEEFNKKFPSEKVDEYSYMLSREKPLFSENLLGSPINGRNATTLSSGTLTPGHSQHSSPVKNDLKTVTFAHDTHKEYYYDPNSRIQSDSKISSDKLPDFTNHTTLLDHDYVDDVTRETEFDDEFSMPMNSQFGLHRSTVQKPYDWAGTIETTMDDIVSLTSGSTSTVTSQDERQFRQGLANLDADIARLQSHLRQMKHS
ncbi:uncharacterized protein LOC102809339 [Saccoglossus kowalevskii]|uniref:Myosin-J heavy chain-like n=1 Tax=Saccoglossus kowalevskii TaxID=10224 RepID=A0ABM0MGG5_SACKO|nr:PREDICTED: myosin-J heavy chain-like [Saccoglossus kowalevskii]